MKLNVKQFNSRSMQLIAAAALISGLTFASAAAFAADQDKHADHVEKRISELHSKLKITPTEEPQWAKVVQAMRDDAKTMDTLTEARVDHAKQMTAVDDLKSYSEITEAHAEGVKKLTAAFSDLYSGMSDTQKKEADALFRNGQHTSGHKASATK